MSPIALLALSLPAAAFAPDGPTWQGVEPQRLQVVHPQVQATLSRSEDWQRFVAAEGAGWRVVWDEVTETPRRLSGPGVPLPTADAATLGEALIRWLTDHADLLGIEPGALSVRHVGRSGDTWYVDLDSLVAGLPVWRGGLTARVKHGRLVDLGVATYPSTPVTGTLRLTATEALQSAITAGPEPGAVHTDREASPILLPIEAVDGLELRRAWLVRTVTAEPPGRWVTFVDGESGALLSVHNEVRFFDGTVLGEHDERSPWHGTLAVSPMPLAEVEGDGSLVTAELDGTFTLAATEYVTDLQGAYARVHNADGPDGVLAGPGPELLWTAADATMAEIDAYVFLHHVRDWGLEIAPEVEIVDGPVDAHVNLDQTCNAYFDGNVNFFRSGGGCNNTARISDVVYHEWGHGLHLWSLESYWTGFDGSLSEGAADTVAFLMTGEPEIGVGFFFDGSPIREVDTDRRYPEDFIVSDQMVHSNGLIFGGAMWDLWTILKADLGEEEGTAVTSAIFTGLLKGGPDIPGAYHEALVADDDNGDLSDGTPHECALIEAFGAHGLGPLGNGSFYVASHELPERVPADAELALRFDLVSAAPNCFPYDPAAATLWYRVDGGDWTSVPATPDATGVDAAIPAQPMGRFVEYWLEVEDGSGASFSAPTGGPINPYGYHAGDVLEVWCHDFEGDDGGFDHRLLDGSDQEGADDWQWGRPQGLSGDPSAAYSGNKVWGNDLGRDDYNGAYQDGKHNRLRSPVLETAHHEGVFLHYRRWLNVEDGYYDQAWIEADNQPVWSNHVSNRDLGDEHHLDDQWIAHAVDLQGLADDGEVRLTWHLQSDAGLYFGGWNIDDVCLFAPDTPDNRLGVHDFDADRDDGQVVLSWTNPPHEPLERVVVVRAADRWPTGPGDGVVVHQDLAPEAGEAVRVFDPTGGKAAGYYAVYASDGASWPTRTVEGLNADAVDGTERVAKSGGPLAEGCGCSSGAGGVGLPGAARWLGLPALLLALRRRRQDAGGSGRRR